MASVVSNTSMTVKDVLNLTVIEFEELLDGMKEYADDVEEQFNESTGKNRDKLEGEAAVSFLMGKFGNK